MKRMLSLLLSAMLLLSALPVAAAAGDVPTEQAVVVIGADLMEDQVEQIYTMFGLTRGTLPELTERAGAASAAEHAAKKASAFCMVRPRS